MVKTLHENLVAFGLSQKEATIYITLLTHREMPVDAISQASSMNRSTVYVQLQNLMNMGLATTFKRGKKTFFSAESPRHIERLLNRRQETIEVQKKDLSALIPDMLNMVGANTDRPSVRIFEGKEGLHTMRNEILLQPIKQVKIMTSIDAMRRVFSRDELMQFSSKREKKKIQSITLYSDNETTEDVKPFTYQKLKRVTKNRLPFEADVYIYGDNVSFASVHPTIVGVTISNAEVARTIEAMFDAAWASQ
jgi:HTH-type transcriptional regulator, sugar sensing transcriptional regulator